jgi:NTP pyrophosphatase (non-canonical NTP hydrolase)
MGRALTFDALRALNVPRVAAFGQTLASWSPMEWACAAAGEMGELCNALKKRSRKEDPKRPGHDITGKPIPSVRDVADEIADVIIYLDLLAAREGIDVGDAVARKWNEVSAKMGFAPRLPLPATANRDIERSST